MSKPNFETHLLDTGTVVSFTYENGCYVATFRDSAGEISLFVQSTFARLVNSIALGYGLIVNPRDYNFSILAYLENGWEITYTVTRERVFFRKRTTCLLRGGRQIRVVSTYRCDDIWRNICVASQTFNPGREKV